MSRNTLWRVNLVAWGGLLVAAAVFVQVPGKAGKLYPTFVEAGQHFRDGQSLYADPPDDRDIFRYSPLAAAIFAPWASVPTPVGSVLWRWLQAGAFLVALRAWQRAVVPDVPWAALALLSLPFVAGNVFNAQLNPLVLALLLAGTAAFARERYTLAAFTVAGAAAFKVYPLAVGLLLCVVEPSRFAPRLLLAACVGCALPFVLQDPEYVCEQLGEWVWRVGGDDRTEQALHQGYHDFQKLLRIWGVPAELEAYRLMEIGAGCLMAGFIAWGRWVGWDRESLAWACGAFGLTWCTLFGPATETATYMLLAPIIAHAVVSATGQPGFERAWVFGAYGLMLSVPIALWFRQVVSAPVRSVTPQAHAALLLLGWLVWQSWKFARIRPPLAERSVLHVQKAVARPAGQLFIVRH
jgi:hypothetical protein